CSMQNRRFVVTRLHLLVERFNLRIILHRVHYSRDIELPPEGDSLSFGFAGRDIAGKLCQYFLFLRQAFDLKRGGNCNHHLVKYSIRILEVQGVHTLLVNKWRLGVDFEKRGCHQQSLAGGRSERRNLHGKESIERIVYSVPALCFDQVNCSCSWEHAPKLVFQVLFASGLVIVNSLEAANQRLLPGEDKPHLSFEISDVVQAEYPDTLCDRVLQFGIGRCDKLGLRAASVQHSGDSGSPPFEYSVRTKPRARVEIQILSV